MAKNYKEYNLSFRERAASKGFAFTLSQLLGFLPLSLGHLIDTLLGLDGIIKLDGTIKYNKNSYDRDNYLRGPFGFILGIVPVLLGMLLGVLLQFTFNLFSYAGYLLDRALGWHKVMVDTPRGNLISVFCYNKPTGQPLPEKMRGPFGFALGLIPELTRYAINFLCAGLVSAVQFSVDHCCDGIRTAYSYLRALIFTNKAAPKNQADNAQANHAAQEVPEEKPANAAPRKRRRLQREKGVEELGDMLSKDPKTKQIIERNIDLFKILGVGVPDDVNNENEIKEFKEAVKKAFRKEARSHHQDKEALNAPGPEPTTRTTWDDILAAKEILLDETLMPNYIKYYKGKNSNLMFNSSAGGAVPQQTPAPLLPDTASQHRKIVRV